MSTAQPFEGTSAGDIAFMAYIPRGPRLSERAAALTAILPFEASALSAELRLSDHQAARLAQLNRSAEWRARLMAVAGHDLRQPLQVVARTLERLSANIVGDDDQKWLQIAFEQIDRIAQGLSDLAIASQHADPTLDQPCIGAVCMRQVLEEIGRSWRLIAAAKGLRLRIAPCSAWVLTDRAMLLTILNNLVGNAIKYTDQGDVLVGCRRVGANLRVAVIDTGRGMSPDELERAFIAFEQIDPSQEGLGLGLWLVGSCCRILAHGLAVSSQPGHGSRFILTTPLTAQRLAAD